MRWSTSISRVVEWRVRKRERWAQAGLGLKDHAVIGYENGFARSLCGSRIPMVRIEVDSRPDESRCCKTCWQLADTGRRTLIQPCPVCSRMMEHYPNGKLRYHTLKFRTPCPGACEKP